MHRFSTRIELRIQFNCNLTSIDGYCYNQRKHIEKYQFPLAIDTFYRYNQRKHIKKHQFPLIIAFCIAKIFWRNQCNSLLRFCCNSFRRFSSVE